MLSNLKIRPYAVMVLALLAASVTLTLSGPRMLAAVRFLPVERAIDRYFEQREIPSERMLTLLGFAREAIARHDHYRFHDGLSMLYYLRGLDLQTPALERRESYRQAEQAAIEVVRRAPAQPEAWLRIATVRATLRDEPEAVIGPWRMSVYTGRTHSTLLVPRVGVGIRYLETMDLETRSMLRDQLLLAWDQNARALVGELRRSDPRLENSRMLIAASHPTVFAELEARVAQAR